MINPPSGKQQFASRKAPVRNKESECSFPYNKLFLDSEPEANAATVAGGLPLAGSERNATMGDRR